MEWNEDSTSVINPFFKGPLLEEKRECHTVGSVAQEVTVSFSLSVFFVPFLSFNASEVCKSFGVLKRRRVQGECASLCVSSNCLFG